MAEQVEDTKFVFVTPVFNCEDTIAQTILSVVAQSYPTWRMQIRDDLSTDGTVAQVRKTVEQLGLQDQIELVVNTEKHGEVRNTLAALETIEDDEVVCRLDGGDWLTDLDGLAILDHAYRSTKAGAVWTAHRWGYTAKNISGPFNDSGADPYKHPWVSSHMKSFRAKLLRDVPDANFRDENGDYIMIACDQAVYLPVLEQAKRQGLQRVFAPFCMYHYSIDLQDPKLFTNERSLRQKATAEWIRERGYVEG
jgi:glycosyltransferase involved in cell wall biosynthesis